MLEWYLHPIPGELDTCWVAMIDGRKFAVIAEVLDPSRFVRRSQFVCVLESNRDGHQVFDHIEGAKHFVERVALATN